MIARRALTAIALGVGVSACFTDAHGAPDLDPNVERTRQAIVGGSGSDSSEDATVMLLHVDPSGPRRLGICTAALIAPRLVLTARHCVSTSDEDVACSADGTPLVGAKVHENHDPANLYVFTGKDRPELIGEEPPSLDMTKWHPAGQGLEIIDDGSRTLCGHDLALVLLKDPIDDVPIAALRLDGEASVGEKLRTVGWGVTSSEVEPSQRQTRGGVSVTRTGPSDADPMLTNNEFLFDESICLGDSGGPVFSERTNAIVGVASRGGNGLDPNAGGPSLTCEGADNIATKLAPFEELVLHAFERAGSQPALEPKLESKAEESCSVGVVGAPRDPHARIVLALGGSLALAIRRRRRT